MKCGDPPASHSCFVAAKARRRFAVRPPRPPLNAHPSSLISHRSFPLFQRTTAPNIHCRIQTVQPISTPGPKKGGCSVRCLQRIQTVPLRIVGRPSRLPSYCGHNACPPLSRRLVRHSSQSDGGSPLSRRSVAKADGDGGCTRLQTLPTRRNRGTSADGGGPARPRTSEVGVGLIAGRYKVSDRVGGVRVSLMLDRLILQGFPRQDRHRNVLTPRYPQWYEPSITPLLGPPPDPKESRLRKARTF